MSSFHEIFGRPEASALAPSEAEEHRAPEWFGPPDDELGVCVPINSIVGRSATGVVAISHVVVYSTGVSFELQAEARDLKPADAWRLFHEQHFGVIDEEEDDDPPPGFLRVGVKLADGSQASNLSGRRSVHNPEQLPSGPVLIQHGGGGGMASRKRVVMKPGWWFWPLPLDGELMLACEWPIVEIALSSIAIDATALRAAATQMIKLWR